MNPQHSDAGQTPLSVLSGTPLPQSEILAPPLPSPSEQPETLTETWSPSDLSTLQPLNSPTMGRVVHRGRELGTLIDQQIETLQPGLFKTTIVTLAQAWKESPRWTALFGATWLVESVSQVASPVIIASLAALSNKPNPTPVVLFTMAALLSNWLIQSVVSDLRPWFNDRFMKAINGSMERRFFADLASRSNATLEHPTFSAIAVSLKDNLSKVSLFVERTLSISSSALTCGLSAIALATSSPLVALGLTGIGVLQLWNGMKSAKRFSEIEDQLGDERRKFWIDRVYAMTASYILDFRAFLKNDAAIDRVEVSRKIINEAQSNDVKKRALGAFGISLISTLLVKGYLIYTALNPALSGSAVDLGEAVKVVFMAATFEMGLFSLLRRFTDQVKDSTFARKALLIGKLGLPDRDPQKEYKRLGQGTPQVEFANVHLFSDLGVPILSDINLRLAPGKIYGVCGASGAGKTSLISLLKLENSPSVGTVRVNQDDIAEIDPSDIRARIGFLSQNYTTLHSYSVREAIQLGSQKDREIEFSEACRIANLDFLGPDLTEADCFLGLDFPNSRRYSGGQLQKIALARTIAHNGDVVILDEPTSALGAEDEKKIFPALVAWARANNKTLVFISHKYANLTSCDQIIFLKNGAIVEQGTHQELLDLSGEYSARYRLEAAQYNSQH